MPIYAHFIAIQIAIFGVVSTLSAEYVAISNASGIYEMNAGDFTGLLGNNNHQFAMSELDILAATLNNDGIETMGHLSFILASTDAGLSLIGLFDGIQVNDPNGSIIDNYLGVSSTTNLDTDWFSTGDVGSQTDWYDMGNGTQLINASLAWDHGQTSAAFAWGDVESAPTGTFNLYDIDLTEFAGNPIQFITFEGNQWEISGTADFSVLGQFAFSYQFIPAPSAIALLGMAGFCGRRSRRRT
ncbi:MAG: hypothetical protein ISR75_04555 [Phycisphaerales bacterium]|nr:hypothetical protein [Planctomycetota bacterium]MBL6997690.1 hypothetical protein [Phycisphaerales bacterium]